MISPTIFCSDWDKPKQKLGTLPECEDGALVIPALQVLRPELYIIGEQDFCQYEAQFKIRQVDPNACSWTGREGLARLLVIVESISDPSLRAEGLRILPITRVSRHLVLLFDTVTPAGT